MISRDFTIEDIHQIRYENYEMTKDLSTAELIKRTHENSLAGWQRISDMRARRKEDTPQ